MIDTKISKRIWEKGGFISRIQGNKGQILREKGEQRRYCIFVPLFPPPPGEQGNRYPWECAGSKANLVSIMRTAKALALEPTSVNQNLMCWLNCRFLNFLIRAEKSMSKLHICLIESEPSSQFENLVLAQMAI